MTTPFISTFNTANLERIVINYSDGGQEKLYPHGKPDAILILPDNVGITIMIGRIIRFYPYHSIRSITFIRRIDEQNDRN